MNKIDIETRDGVCPSYVFEPRDGGPWPAVLVFMDGVGIRPAMLEMGERIAAEGYLVLLPDLFYRAGPYEPMDPHAVFADPEKRKELSKSSSRTSRRRRSCRTRRRSSTTSMLGRT